LFPDGGKIRIIIAEKRYKIKDLPKSDRPREKLISKSPQNLKDEELLARF